MIDNLRNKFHRLETAAIDARAATELSRLGLGYLPWSSSGLRPAALASVLNDVIVNRRKCLVELGAGISTVYLAKILAEKGGRLVSVDHDTDWLRIVFGMLESHGLSDFVELVAAPLTATRSPLCALPWYDTAPLYAALGESTVDLLLVDGPVAHDESRQLARYPALPVLREKLSPRCAVILDDANRKGEREVLQRWKELPGFDFSVRINNYGLAVLARGQAFTADL